MSELLMARPSEPRKPWGLIVALTIAAGAGLLSLPLQFATFKNIDAVSQQDIARNRVLVEQVKMLEEQNAGNVDEHRVANDAAHAEQCRLILEIATKVGLEVTPCRFDRLNDGHHATPAPTPK